MPGDFNARFVLPPQPPPPLQRNCRRAVLHLLVISRAASSLEMTTHSVPVHRIRPVPGLTLAISISLRLLHLNGNRYLGQRRRLFLALLSTHDNVVVDLRTDNATGLQWWWVGRTDGPFSKLCRKLIMLLDEQERGLLPSDVTFRCWVGGS